MTLKVSSFADIAEARDHFLQRVDNSAESILFVTPSRIESYEAKHREALEGSGPYLEAEAEALGVPVESVVQSVLDARQARVLRASRVEAARIRAKALIREAQTPAEMHRIAKHAFERLDA